LWTFLFSPLGFGGTLAVGDLKHFNFGLSVNVSVGVTSDGFVVFQAQITHYDKVLGAYAGGGLLAGGSFSMCPTNEGPRASEKPQRTYAGGFAWKGGRDIEYIVDKEGFSVQTAGIRFKDTGGYGAFIAKGETFTMQNAVDIKPLLRRIRRYVEK
jgi:hypothetical protein